MTKKIIIIISFLLFPSLALAEPLGFRDFKMGMSKIEVMSTYDDPSLDCGEGYCRKFYDIYDIPVRVFYYFNSSYLQNDKVHYIGIKFDSKSYSDIKERLIEKYGKKYKCSQSIVQNRMSAKFSNEDCEWKLKEGEVSVLKYGDDLDEGVIHLFDNEYLKALKKGKKKKKEGKGF